MHAGWRSTLLLLIVLSGLIPTEGVGAEPSANASPALQAADPLAPWQGPLDVRPVSNVAGRHTMHSYYVCNPESPDGRHLLYFASRDPAGHVGEIVVRERSTGVERIIARDVHVEDAHRAACQQWVSGGRRVAYHEVRDRRWRVMVVDLESGSPRVVAEDRQLAFGRSEGDLLPLYGCHWNPGEHRDLELADVADGTLRKVATAAQVQARFGDWARSEFNDRPISIFFPVLSPDQSRIFLKIAAGNGGEAFMSKDASHRQGLLVYDLKQGDFCYFREKWGHPAWFPDSRRIVEMGNIVLDSTTGTLERIPNLPQLRGVHPSINPAGTLLAADGLADFFSGRPGEWCVIVGDLRGGRHALIHLFDNQGGARSWRRSHPHPVFSADGRRLYFNVSAGEHTRLFVAEPRTEN